MKRILLFIFALLIFLTPNAFADEGWIINNFQSDITLEESGIAKITETIYLDFMNLEKHGIYRDIPYIYDSPKGEAYTEISINQVSQNNTQAKYQITRHEGYIRIKIGDPDKTISGKNTYKIGYTAIGILKGFSEHDELYWNVTGNNWPVPITQVNAIVTLPKDGIIKTACFHGIIGSTSQCKSMTLSPRSAHFNATAPLNASEGMTIVAGYKKGLVPLLTVQRPKTFLEKFFAFPSLTTLAISLLFGIFVILFLWFKYGRDYWFNENLFAKKNGHAVLKPLGGHETIVVEFTPPDNLTPAEIGVLMDEKAHTHDIIAAIIDLAARGYLTITEVPKKWLFGKTDYILTKQKDPKHSKKPLLTYEKNLLQKLFHKNNNTITVSELQTTFYEELKEIKEELYDEVLAKNLFPSNPDNIRAKYTGTAVLLIVTGIFGTTLSITNDFILLADLSLSATLSGLILVIVAQFMPRRTAYGRNLYRRAKGYRLFIEKAEKYRQQYFEKENLFNQVLPYAIVFGLTEKFAKAMQKIGLKNTNTGWYVGAHPFNTLVFASGINDFSNSISSAMASAPKGSGFSGGGGSSGGGFGGGGGGGW